jgi:hypothetical protein
MIPALIRSLHIHLRPLLFGAALMAIFSTVRAGPPYITDDPEPVEYKHWEVYIASITQHSSDDFAGTLPHLELNYGVIPDVQLHLVIPNAFDSAAGETRKFGLGDIELGAKYRFLHETDAHPQIGIFPLVELPTGDASRGLGSGHTQLFLPVWIQKSWDKFTTYGGGGYWVTPGTGNRNSWFGGWLGQYQVTKSFTPGVEVYYRTALAVDATPTAQLNFGFVWDLSENYHILASAGPSIHGPHSYQTYLGFQWTFGPEEKGAGK